MAATIEQNRPKTVDSSGKRVAKSGNKETLFILPDVAMYREDFKTFSDKCDADGIHINDKLRAMINAYAPSTLK